jgi:hypothetical protein
VLLLMLNDRQKLFSGGGGWKSIDGSGRLPLLVDF